MKKLDNLTDSQANWLFWGCFAALMATSVGFMVRAQTIGAMGTEFGLSETQKGEIFGVGLWPFSISIIIFSLLISVVSILSFFYISDKDEENYDKITQNMLILFGITFTNPVVFGGVILIV